MQRARIRSPMPALLAATLVLTAACNEPVLPSASTLRIDDGAELLVQDIVKGDEVVVTNGKDMARVRLVGLHAFDAKSADATLSALGEVSAQLLRARLQNQRVTLRIEAPFKDSYGRTLAYVELNGVDVNRSLIEQGVALLYDEYPFGREARYRDAETKARAEQAGLWVKPAAAALCDGLKRQWASARTQHTREAR